MTSPRRREVPADVDAAMRAQGLVPVPRTLWARMDRLRLVRWATIYEGRGRGERSQSAAWCEPWALELAHALSFTEAVDTAIVRRARDDPDFRIALLTVVRLSAGSGAARDFYWTQTRGQHDRSKHPQ